MQIKSDHTIKIANNYKADLQAKTSKKRQASNPKSQKDLNQPY